MNDRILEHYLEEFRMGVDVDPAEAEILFDALVESDNQFLLSQLLATWNEKGVDEEELFAFASILRDRMVRIGPSVGASVDIVGTGGSTAKTFNVSTAAAFVTAGAGVMVAKHGNRAATSGSGSSDVLSGLGIEIDVDPSVTSRTFAEHGLCFMFAPRFHSLSPTLAKARRSIGRPTIFNNLGPLCNPASPPHHVIGVWNPDVMETTSNVLKRLGTGRSWIVSGDKRLDEISLTGKTSVFEIDTDVIRQFDISAADFGIAVPSGDLPSNCTPDESATVIRSVLANEQTGRPAEVIVLMNAAAAIYITGKSTTLADGYSIAEKSLRTGSAMAKLRSLAAEALR